MRIAQVAPLYERGPPRFYGGTERVVAYLTEGLVERGHQVTLFASGDSCTRAELVPCAAAALRLDGRCRDPLVPHLIMLEEVVRRAHRFDVVHFHCDYVAFPVGRRLPVPSLTTLHGRLDLPDLKPLVSEFGEAALVSISDAQRQPLPNANWLATVHHGLPRDLLPFSAKPGKYLAFLGRVSPEKRVDQAIELARRVGIPLRIAAKVDRADSDYFERQIRPLLADPLVEFIGEVNEEQKAGFLGGALALVFLIDWPEPFGLAMIESLACGTPVIAARCGSVPEVIEDGVTGFVVDGLQEAVRAVSRLPRISRATCREVFERRFCDERMVADYLRVYESLVLQESSPMVSVA
jgi:glycosyltransferase involved in cell wall biosynthesis